MVKAQMTNVAYLGEGAGPKGQIRNWQVRFEINGPGLSTVVEIPAEAPMEDVAGWPVLFAGALSVKLLKVFT